MPLEFIPNQPIIFEKPIGDYQCLNNDTKSYAQLMQDEDELCIQWKLSPCSQPICEPNMVMPLQGENKLGDWDAEGGWSSSSSSNLSFDGTGNPAGYAEQTITGLIPGAVYQLSFDVLNFTGSLTYEIAFIGIPSFFIKSAGNYTFYFIAPDTSTTINFAYLGTSSNIDTLVIGELQLIQWTDCWRDELFGDLASWNYEFDGINGKFCSSNTLGGDLINSSAFTNIGNYHGVELVISDCTKGNLEVKLGSISFGSTTGNGTFRFYGIPTAGTDLKLVKLNDFDGCVSQVTVSDYGVITDYKVKFTTDDSTTVSADYSAIVFEDRLVFCNKLSNLTWTVNGVPDGSLTCELLKTVIFDVCTDEFHTSVNYINYNSAGWECTKVVESWNDGYAFGFYFGDIASPDFVLRQRLRVLAFNPVYKNSGEEYLYSSGNTGRSYAQSQKARTAWFDYMDEYAHDCTRTQLLGQKLMIDGYAFYYPTEDYEPQWNERGAYNLAQSRVTVFHEEAIFGSMCGTMANSVCPPQIIITPPQPLSKVTIKLVNFDMTGLDATSINYLTFNFDSLGNTTGFGSGGPFDLTDAVQRASLATTIATAIDTVYGTTNTNLSCTFSSNILNLNVECTGSISIPMLGISIALNDLINSFGLPITFE